MLQLAAWGRSYAFGTFSRFTTDYRPTYRTSHTVFSGKIPCGVSLHFMSYIIWQSIRSTHTTDKRVSVQPKLKDRRLGVASNFDFEFG